jgi:hypothetical protein
MGFNICVCKKEGESDPRIPAMTIAILLFIEVE